MRIKGDIRPENAFSIEKMPKKQGKVRVRFYENALPFEEKDGEITISGYEYDEYQLVVDDRPGLATDIERNLSAYLAQARLSEVEQKTIPDLVGDIQKLTSEKTTLENQLTDTQLALCDVYEQILGG